MCVKACVTVKKTAWVLVIETPSKRGNPTAVHPTLGMVRCGEMLRRGELFDKYVGEEVNNTLIF